MRRIQGLAESLLSYLGEGGWGSVLGVWSCFGQPERAVAAWQTAATRACFLPPGTRASPTPAFTSFTVSPLLLALGTHMQGLMKEHEDKDNMEPVMSVA